MLTTIEQLETIYGGPNERSRLPSTGAILKHLGGETFDAVKYDLELVERLRTGLY